MAVEAFLVLDSVTARETFNAEKDLADTTHLDFLRTLGDPVAAVVPVDVLCRRSATRVRVT